MTPAKLCACGCKQLAEGDLIPRFATADCRTRWVNLMDLGLSPATHFATGEGWAPLAAAPAVEDAVVEVAAPVTAQQLDTVEWIVGGATRVVPLGKPFEGSLSESLQREPQPGSWLAGLRARWARRLGPSTPSRRVTSRETQEPQ